jgi:hypothetical protein
VGCSLILGFLGQRGQDEANAVHAISYARQIDETHYDVAQWGSAFVTSGAVYDFTHAAPHGLYASAREGVLSGEIRSGKDASFRVEIPLNSFQSFLFRGKLQGDPIRVSPTRWVDQDGRLELTLSVDPGPAKPWAGAWAVCGTEIYPLTPRGGSILTSSNPIANADSFVTQTPRGRRQDYRQGFREGNEGDITPQEVMLPLARTVVAHAGGGMGFLQYTIKFPDAERSRDTVRVFILAPSPENFHVKGRRLGRRVGYVLYEIDLFRQ